MSAAPVALGIHPKIWGPQAWSMFHTLASQNPALLIKIVESMKCILPCPRCRLNYARHIELLGPLTIKNAERWVYQLHNMVSGQPTSVAVPKFATVIAKTRAAAPWHPRDSAIFLEAIVESHPGARQITASQVACLRNFWQAVAPGPGAKNIALESKMELRAFWSKLKKEWGIHAKPMGLKPACNSDVCVI